MSESEESQPKRKSPRLSEFDYSGSGIYFVTICTKDRKCTLGRIERVSSQECDARSACCYDGGGQGRALSLRGELQPTETSSFSGAHAAPSDEPFRDEETPVGTGLCPVRSTMEIFQCKPCFEQQLPHETSYPGAPQFAAGFIDEQTICRLSPSGLIVFEEINLISERYENVRVDKFIIMPNHVHMIVRLDHEGIARPSLSSVIGSMKSRSTKRINMAENTSGTRFWQSRFHDHVIRDELDYERIWEYVENNPRRWELDTYYEGACNHAA